MLERPPPDRVFIGKPVWSYSHSDSYSSFTDSVDSLQLRVADSFDNPQPHVADSVDNPQLHVADPVDNPQPHVADSVDNPQLHVADPVDDLRPKAKDVQITLDAVYDIRFCEKLFDKWMTEFDDVTSDSKKRDGRVQTLRLYLGRLKERAGLFSNASNEILQSHGLFASLMAQWIDDASKSQHDLKYEGPLAETTKLAKNIRKTSSFLSTHVTEMTYELESFVSALEVVRVTVQKGRVQKEQSLAKRIATIFATLSLPISGPDRHHPDPKIRGSRLANTALGQAAFEFGRVDSEPQDGKESGSLESVILFLKEVVPKEVHNAQKKLERSDEALEIIERMRADQWVTPCSSDAEAVAEEWRDVAEQYQLAIEQKEFSVQSHSGVSVTGVANVVVPVNEGQGDADAYKELQKNMENFPISPRPRFKTVQITLDAIEDIRFCEKLFDKWITELDKVLSDPDNLDGRELTLRLYLMRLKERAGLCSDTTNEILQYHVQFASLLAQRFDDASKSQYDLKDDDIEPTRLAKDIRTASSFLSDNVQRMKLELMTFVSILRNEKVRVTVQKRVATIFATLSPSVSSTVHHHPDPKIRESRLAETALGQAASEFCRVDSEHWEGKESEGLDSVILFLKEIVPREATNAQKKLEQSDEPIKIMERIRADQRILYGSDAAAVAEEWRNVAEQYQSAFEQKESPPSHILPPERRTLLQSKKTPGLNWFSRSGAADVVVQVDDLRPRFKIVQTTLDAIEDIRFCEKLFDKWMAELDKVPIISNNRDRQEQKLRLHLGRLEERAGLSSNATNEILQYHVRFACLLAQLFDDASESQHDLKYDGPLAETTKFAKNMRKISSFLSTRVTEMTYELESFVSALQMVRISVQKERSLVELTLRWLRSLFQVIKRIFATLLPSNSVTERHHPDPKIRESRLAETALIQAATEFCRVDSEPREGKEFESLDLVIQFFEVIVPREVKNAQKTLEQSDEPIKIMERMKAGQRVALVCGSDAAIVAEEWRNVAKQYQSAFELNESCS